MLTVLPCTIFHYSQLLSSTHLLKFKIKAEITIFLKKLLQTRKNTKSFPKFYKHRVKIERILTVGGYLNMMEILETLPSCLLAIEHTGCCPQQEKSIRTWMFPTKQNKAAETADGF